MNEPIWPDTIADVQRLESLLSRPTPAVVRTIQRVEGDIILLGAGGKMGPTLACMAAEASRLAGGGRRVIAVSRFSDVAVREKLHGAGIETIQGDLLEPEFVDALPAVPNVIFMAGMKFGSQGNEALTWAENALLPSLVCRKFRHSRIVAFSTGNIYGLVSAVGTGSVESDAPNPSGEYAMSCLGRERMFEYFSRTLNIPTVLIRLNYAVELRYGVLVDLAQQVFRGQVVDLTMGHVNVIWQGDASALTLCALPDAASPPLCLNVAGDERLSVRRVCERFGEIFGRPARFAGAESSDALLSNAQAAFDRYGPPSVDADRMIRWIADWVISGAPALDRPTHFEVRDGKF